MPSRKRAQGKARKKAKSEAKSKRVAEATTTWHWQEPSSDSLMQRCTHGRFPWLMDVCVRFAAEFIEKFTEASERGDGSNPLDAALEATSAEEYDEVWRYASKMEWVVSYFLSLGTQHAITGFMKDAHLCAYFACFFEQDIKVVFYGTRDSIDLTKVKELNFADNHTLISYLKHRIPCSCLDEKYKEVKSTKKMGICFNKGCGFVERDRMFNCTRCRLANYCSEECQEAAWPTHKKWCKEHATAVKRAQARLELSALAQQCRSWGQARLELLDSKQK